jgi:hypothetical protein
MSRRSNIPTLNELRSCKKKQHVHSNATYQLRSGAIVAQFCKGHLACWRTIGYEELNTNAKP